jgi:hypothetical protein
MKGFWGLRGMQLSAKFHFRVATRPEEGRPRLQLGRDEAKFPATPADIGVLPVPVQSGKDLSVVVGNFAEVDDQAC